MAGLVPKQLLPGLVALAAEAEKHNIKVEILDKEIKADNSAVKVGEGELPEVVVAPTKIPKINFYDPVVVSPSGQSRRRERRAMERRLKKK